MTRRSNAVAASRRDRKVWSRRALIRAIAFAGAALAYDVAPAGAQFLSGYVIVSAVVDGTNDSKLYSLECPAGATILGGGARTTEPGVYITASRPGGSIAWNASASEYAAVAGSWSLEVTAICGRVADRGTYSEASAQDSVSPKALTAECPGGTTVLGGGALAYSLAPPQKLGITSSAPDGNGWYARAYEIEPTSGSWELDVWAICGNVPDRVVVNETTTPTSFNSKIFDATCPADLVVLSGGGFVGLDAREAISASHPSGDAGWTVAAFEPIPHAEVWTLRTSAICAPEPGAALLQAAALVTLHATRRARRHPASGSRRREALQPEGGGASRWSSRAARSAAITPS